MNFGTIQLIFICAKRAHHIGPGEEFLQGGLIVLRQESRPLHLLNGRRDAPLGLFEIGQGLG